MNFKQTYFVKLSGFLKRNKFLHQLFYAADERSVIARNNIMYSSVYRGIGMVLGLWMVPLTLGYLNPTKYGIWLTLTSLITWLNFFDIGFSNGLRVKLAEALARREYVLAKNYISTTYFLLTLIVTILFVAFLLVNPFINWASLLNAEGLLNEDLNTLILFVFLFFCLRFVSGLILVILNADQKLAMSGFLDLLVSVLSLLAVYIISRLMPNSLLLLGSSLSFIPAIVFLIAGAWLLRSTYKQIRPSFSHVDFKLTKVLTHLSVQFFILQIVVLLIFFSNNIIIAHLLNPAKVSEFNIVYKYFNVITTISILILNPFWSAATEAYTKNEFGWLQNASQRLLKLWLINSGISVIMIIASPFVYSMWLGDRIEISFTASLAMGVYVILLNWHNTYVYLINGIGKIRLQLYIYIVMGIFVVPLSYIFIRLMNMGIEGSIVSMIICLIPASILIPIQFNMIVKNKAQGLFNK